MTDHIRRITVEISLYADDERDAQKKLDAWLRDQEDNDDLVSYIITDYAP